MSTQNLVNDQFCFKRKYNCTDFSELRVSLMLNNNKEYKRKFRYAHVKNKAVVIRHVCHMLIVSCDGNRFDIFSCVFTSLLSKYFKM